MSNINFNTSEYLVIAIGYNQSGNPYGRAQKIINVQKTKNSSMPASFLDAKDSIYVDGTYQIGDKVLVERNIIG